MLRRLLTLALALLTAATLGAPAVAEFSLSEAEAPTEPIETENDRVRIVAEYNSEADQSIYTLALKDGARFPDGTPVTAQDVLFSLYVQLDPGHTGGSAADSLSIPGLICYRAQVSAEHYADALKAMASIDAAGHEHIWNETDGWTEAAQTAYWSLRTAYESACEQEFPICAQHIVDACLARLTPDAPGAFGKTADEVRADESLHVAYAMVQWGYAECEDETTVVSARSKTVWQLDGGFAPTIEDFVGELKLAYDDDLAACWAVEAADSYVPALPDVEGEFVCALYAGAPDSVTAIEGICLQEDCTIQIALSGVDMRSEIALFGQVVLSKDRYADESLWDPDSGNYGHAFGDVAAIDEAAASDEGAYSTILLEPSENGFFTFS